MNNKLFVAGLPFTSTEDGLRSYFSSAGDISSVTIITDRETRRSKGFGFVEFKNPDDASKAIQMFDGQDFGGRKLVVAVAKPMENRERSGGGFDRNRSRGGFGGNGDGYRGRDDRRGGFGRSSDRGGGRGGFRGGR